MNTTWLRDFAIGIHSNIPICCVMYFCNVWIPMYSDEDRESFAHWDGDQQYIRCPECYKTGNRNNIHRCKPNMKECFINELDKVLYPAPYKHEVLGIFERDISTVRTYGKGSMTK